jgi:hypothetical protein
LIFEIRLNENKRIQILNQKDQNEHFVTKNDRMIVKSFIEDVKWSNLTSLIKELTFKWSNWNVLYQKLIFGPDKSIFDDLKHLQKFQIFDRTCILANYTLDLKEIQIGIKLQKIRRKNDKFNLSNGVPIISCEFQCIGLIIANMD